MTTSTIDALCIDPTCDQNQDWYGRPKPTEHNAHDDYASRPVTPAEINAKWGEVKHHVRIEGEFETEVRLSGAPQIRVRDKALQPHHRGRPLRPFAIKFHYIHGADWRWNPVGPDKVTIYARSGFDLAGAPWFAPEDVIDMPDWLADILARGNPATPGVLTTPSAAADSKPLADLIAELRLVERKDGGSTREPGSARAEALAEEIGRRIARIENVAGATGNPGLMMALYGDEEGA